MRRMGSVSVVLAVGLLVSFMITPCQVAFFLQPGTDQSLSSMRVVKAQEMSSPWNRTYGGGLSDGGSSVVEVSTGGFACAGYTMSSGAGQQDVWLVRTAVDGSAQWSQTYGGSDSDWGRSLLEVNGGGFIIVGETFSFGEGSTDVWVLRTSAEGTLLWNQTYGGFWSDAGTAMVEVSGGGFIIAGSTENFGAQSNDVWLLRIDADGNHLWNQTYGGTGTEAGFSVVEVSTGGFAIGGWTNSFGAGSEDVWLIRTDTNGNLLWSRTYGGNDSDLGHSVAEVSGGGFIITGSTKSFGVGNSDVWLLRTTADGTLLWNRTYGGPLSDVGSSVLQMSGGGFIIAGSNGGTVSFSDDVWVLRTDTDGTLQWNQTYGGGNIDRGFSMVGVSTGGFAILGATFSFGAGDEDFWLIRIIESGLWPSGLPIDPLLLLMVIIVIVVVVVVLVVVLRRRRGKPQQRKRKK